MIGPNRAAFSIYRATCERSGHGSYDGPYGCLETDGRRKSAEHDHGPQLGRTLWVEFLRGLARRGLRGTKLVTSETHRARKPPSPRYSQPPRDQEMVSLSGEHQDLGGVMLRRSESYQRCCRWRGLDTIVRTMSGMCHRGHAFGSVAAGVLRVWSTASAGAWRSACW